MAPKSLYDRIWDDHVIAALGDGTVLIGIDRHLLHEVTSPQAFDGLRKAGRRVRHAELTLAVPDHNVPTMDRTAPVADPASARQLEALSANCRSLGIEHIAMSDPSQGIVHVIGPEQGFTLPGVTLVCGDSHTSTHGALGALAFGIGTSEIETVLGVQALVMRKALNMRILIEGVLGIGVTAKDLALHLIGTIGTAGATGHVIEFAGTVVDGMSVEARMTLCNMAIEAGARSGLIAPDAKTIAYLQDRPRAPRGADWHAAVAWWTTLRSDPDAVFDRDVRLDASKVRPNVTWGTSPEHTISIDEEIPPIDDDPARGAAMQAALDYMGLVAGAPVAGLAIDQVFIGSCTNGRIEDLRQAASVLRGRRVAGRIQRALVVPGSGLVRAQAEDEGLDKVFLAAGFEWREAGCSMCLGMNPDQVPPGQRCASTSNRNFVGRQGPNARTHLMSPAMAAAAAVAGRIIDVRSLEAV